jgi:hypothetical protein
MVREQRDETTQLTSPLIAANDAAVIVANATANVTISNVAPAAVGTATISKWLKITIADVDYYIPLWT